MTNRFLVKSAWLLLAASFFVSAGSKADRAPSNLPAPNSPIPNSVLKQLDTECRGSTTESCYFLGLINAKHDKKAEANELFQLGCRSGDSRACSKLSGSEYLSANSTSAQTIVLPNGFRAILFPTGSIPNAVAKLQIGTGERGRRGIAALVPFVLVQKEKSGYFHAKAAKGEDLDISVETDETNISVEMPSLEVLPALTAFSEIIKPQTITETEIKTAREQMMLWATRNLKGKIHTVATGWLENLVKIQEENRNDPMVKLFAKGRDNAESITKFLSENYTPDNARLFIVGNFDAESVKTAIENNFGTIAKTALGKKTNREYTVHSGRSFSVVLGHQKPILSWGTKFWKTTAADYSILSSYLSYRANSLPSTMRSAEERPCNLQYRVVVYPDLSGDAYLTVTSDPERFDRDLRYVTDILKHEAQQGGITDVQVEIARKEFLERFSFKPNDLKGQMAYVEWIDWFQRIFETSKIPQDFLKDVSPSVYRASLRKNFSADQETQRIEVPPAFFPGDRGLLLLSALVASIVWFRRKIRGSFPSESVDRLGIIGYSFPSWMIFLSMSIAFIILVAIGHNKLFTIENLWSWFGQHYWFRFYLQTPVCLLIAALCWLRVMSYFPRQLFVSEDLCLLVCFFGRVREIRLDEIESIRVCSHSHIFLSVPWSVSSFHLGSIFQRGVLITLRSGRGYFLGIEKPDAAEAILRARLGQKTFPLQGVGA